MDLSGGDFGLCEVAADGRFKDIRYDEYAARAWEIHKDRWLPMEPEYGRNFILFFMFEDIGEFIAIIKKKGDTAIAEDAGIRADFVEEMSDVFMYFTDALLRYGITPEEISEAYMRKHGRKLGRDYEAEYEDKYQ